MGRLWVLVFFVMIVSPLLSQVVTTDPALPVESGSVVITFNADQGSLGLMGYTGDVYAHTGVITDQSSSTADWKYVKADWSTNISACKMTRLSTNVYQLTISPSIREFYGVPQSEKILKLAFVFRSSDGTKEGKDTGSKDIFVDVYEAGLNVSFITPSVNYAIVQPQSELNISVSGINCEKIDLLLDEQVISTTTALSLDYVLNVPATGKHMLRAVATGSGLETSDTCWFIVKEPTPNATRPIGLKRGANRVDDQTETFLIYAPDKEYIYLAGDFNDWMPANNHQMNKDGDYFWVTVDGLLPDKEYSYQYWIDGSLQIADPYTNKILDPANDKYISSNIYPDLLAYPTGKTSEIVSVFSTKPQTFNWTVNNFQAPQPDTMVVYELLIRDFTANKDIKTVTDTLSYLKRLGVNVIELMPINEFEGNDSWGYNPSFYFAPDKAYGTINDYKAFVDACHRNGIAVVQDLVLNHSFGQSPFVRMYFDGSKPASNNPWYNVNHNMQNPDAQWGYDFNHESIETQALVDSICSFWLSEFKMDGFRFDFTKGFTNTIYGPTDWASAYDASRIKILNRMVNQIKVRKSDAIVIFEHLADNSEEKELSENGILLWGNHNYNFSQAAMGYNTDSKSDFSWASYQARGWSKPAIVNYMESHDEERLMYNNLEYGNSNLKYDTTDPQTALKRMEIAGAFLFAIPGPKMIWQFGELGYDVSINEGGRTASKPLHWEYQNDVDRQALYKMWSDMIHLKKVEPVFSSTDYSMNVVNALKTISFKSADNEVVLVGNFDIVKKTASVTFSSAGIWYDYFYGDSIQATGAAQGIDLNAGEFRLLSKKHLDGFEQYVTPPSSTKNKTSFAYPNPCQQQLTIYNPFDEAAILEVFSLSGSKLMQYGFVEGQSSYKPDISNWSGGLYILKIKSNAGNEAFQKLIKY